VWFFDFVDEHAFDAAGLAVVGRALAHPAFDPAPEKAGGRLVVAVSAADLVPPVLPRRPEVIAVVRVVLALDAVARGGLVVDASGALALEALRVRVKAEQAADIHAAELGQLPHCHVQVFLLGQVLADGDLGGSPAVNVLQREGEHSSRSRPRLCAFLGEPRRLF